MDLSRGCNSVVQLAGTWTYKMFELVVMSVTLETL